MFDPENEKGVKGGSGRGALIINYDLAKCREILSGLHARIAEYATTDNFYEEYELALYEYFERRNVPLEGEEAPDEFFRDEDEFERFMTWYSFHFITDGRNKTFPSLYRQVNRYQLSPFEDEILKSYENSCLSLYEVLRVDPGKGFELKDLFSGQVCRVQDGSCSRVLCKWDIMYAGLVCARGMIFLSGFEAVVIPPRLRSFLRGKILDMFEAERKEYGSFEEFLRVDSSEIGALVENVLEDDCEEPVLNNDGDLLCLATLHYRIPDPAAFAGKIGESPHFSLESVRVREGNRAKEIYTWIRQPKEGFKIYDSPPLGILKVEGNRLKAECNSRERAKRLKSLLEDTFGSLLQYKTLIYEDPEARIPFWDPLGDGEAGIVAAGGFENWLDEEIPALDGMTPREAAVTPGGRERLIDLLKELENENERILRLGLRNDGQPDFPVGKIMKELGL